MVFAIGNNDYSGKVLMDTYNVNQMDVYSQWEDANGRTHRDVYRKKVVGSFDMLISDLVEYQDFISDVQTHTVNGGYVRCKIAINNTNAENVQKDLFIDYSSIVTRSALNRKGYLSFTVNIEER